MSRLRLLNETITGVTSQSAADALIKTWVPHQSGSLDGLGTATAEGTSNCSLAAMLIVGFYSCGASKYLGHEIGSSKMEAGIFDLKKHLKKDNQVMVVATGGHDFAIVREGGSYGLYQAWDGEFEVFPKLNDDNESHNIFGTGDETVHLINNEVGHIRHKCNHPFVEQDEKVKGKTAKDIPEKDRGDSGYYQVYIV